MANPKAALQEALALAADLSGRKLRIFNTRFSRNRAQLLEILDHNGPVSRLTSWKYFVEDILTAIES